MQSYLRKYQDAEQKLEKAALQEETLKKKVKSLEKRLATEKKARIELEQQLEKVQTEQNKPTDPEAAVCSRNTFETRWKRLFHR